MTAVADNRARRFRAGALGRARGRARSPGPCRSRCSESRSATGLRRKAALPIANLLYLGPRVRGWALDPAVGGYRRAVARSRGSSRHERSRTRSGRGRHAAPVDWGAWLALAGFARALRRRSRSPATAATRGAGSRDRSSHVRPRVAVNFDRPCALGNSSSCWSFSRSPSLRRAGSSGGRSRPSPSSAPRVAPTASTGSRGGVRRRPATPERSRRGGLSAP